MFELILSVLPQQVAVSSEIVSVEQATDQVNTSHQQPVAAPEKIPPETKSQPSSQTATVASQKTATSPASAQTLTEEERKALEAAKSERLKLIQQKLAEIVAREKAQKEARSQQTSKQPAPEQPEIVDPGQLPKIPKDMTLSELDEAELLQKIQTVLSRKQPTKPAQPVKPAAKTTARMAPQVRALSSYVTPVAPPVLGSSIRLWQGRLKLGNGDLRLIFPLPIPAEFTSGFGWRIHPVSGESRFHQGVDLGAAIGTPVVATFSGKVALADWMGGYGLTVVLTHNNGTQETLYGHLSEIFVRPGEEVKQGTVIGRVGNTGLSTGPHLHFEFRQLTAEGWTALDPAAQLQVALAQLTGGFQMSLVAQQSEDMSDDFAAIPPPPTMKRAIVHNF